MARLIPTLAQKLAHTLLVLAAFGLSAQMQVHAQVHPQVQTQMSPEPQVSSSASDATQTLVVSYKQTNYGDLRRETYEQKLIELALEKTQQKVGAIELVPVNVISRTHTVAALSQNLYSNFVTSLSYEDTLVASGNLIYIPIPIELGALSYRICYAHKSLISKVRTVETLEQLKPYKVAVGADWLDGKILQHHGVQIVKGDNITGLFRMTQAGRADLFCPNPAEYFHELENAKVADLQLDNQLALYYPLPKFLFTHKSNQALLDRIQLGMEMAYQDGSYLQLWKATHGKNLARAKLNERHLIKLDNPFISSLPASYERYLFDPLQSAQ